jgi:hypothetical protein
LLLRADDASASAKETAVFKRQFKVISPMPLRDGGTYWLRCGTGYVNKDNSINVYLDALPLTLGKDGRGVTIQLRELTDEELRERAEKRATYSTRGTLHSGGGNASAMPPSLGAYETFTPPNGGAAADAVPF